MEKILAIMVVLVAFGPPALAADQVTLTVALVDGNGDPIGDAELTASWDDGSTTRTTASNGKAFMDVPAGADVTIEVDHEDYVRNRPVTVEDATASELEIAAAPKASATVTVVDRNGPVSDATVRFRTDGHVAATAGTGANGVAESGVVEAGEYAVAVRKPGYLRTTADVPVEGETTREITVEQGSVTVDFAVRDDHFDEPRPVSGVDVTVAGVGTVKTLDNGEAAMRLPVNTKFDVSVEKEGYASTSDSVAVGESDERLNVTVRRAPNVSVSALSERVVAGERVRLEVTDEYGAPVAGASVTLDGETAATTDASGVALVRLNEAGEHAIAATNGSLESAAVTVAAIGDGATAETTTAPTETTTATTASSGASSVETLGQPGFELLTALAGLVAGLAVLFVRHGR